MNLFISVVFLSVFFQTYFFRMKVYDTGISDWKNNNGQSIALLENSVSRHHGSQIEGPPETPRTITALTYWLAWGRPIIGSPLCRETLACSTVGRYYCSALILIALNNLTAFYLGYALLINFKKCIYLLIFIYFS